MAKVIASIALGAASLGFVAQPAGAGVEAKQPTPEALQAWYKVPPTKTKAASSPEVSIGSLNLLYGVMFEYKAQDDDKRFDAGRAGSKAVDSVVLCGSEASTASPERAIGAGSDATIGSA